LNPTWFGIWIIVNSFDVGILGFDDEHQVDVEVEFGVGERYGMYDRPQDLLEKIIVSGVRE
jgi:hypothetical protein